MTDPEHESIDLEDSGSGPCGEEALLQRFHDLADREDTVLVPGFHAVKHARRFGARFECVLTGDKEGILGLCPDLGPDMEQFLREEAVEIRPGTFRAIQATAQPNPLLAVARRPAHSMGQVLAAEGSGPVVFLENPHHLGNLGAVVRVSAAAGAAGVLTTGRHDPWEPLSMVCSAGLHFALPVVRCLHLDPSDRPLIAVDPGGRPLEPGSLPERAVLAFGTERHGLSREILQRAHDRVCLPMREKVSSLNLATAVAATLYRGI